MWSRSSSVCTASSTKLGARFALRTSVTSRRTPCSIFPRSASAAFCFAARKIARKYARSASSRLKEIFVLPDIASLRVSPRCPLGAATLSVARVLDQAFRRAAPLTLPAGEHLLARAAAAFGHRQGGLEEAALVGLRAVAVRDAREALARDREQLAREREHRPARHFR